MKILLVVAPKDGECVEGTTPSYLLYDFASYPPLGLLAIAAEVDPRHTLKVLDAVTKNMSIDDVVEYTKNFKPDIFGISVVSRRIYPAYAITKKIKESLPGIITIAGGPHINDWGYVTMALGSLDYALAGYGEKSFPQFVEAMEKIKYGAEPAPLQASIPGLLYRVNGEIVVNPPAPTPKNLDDLPFPKRELVDANDYFTLADKLQMTTIYTSRGCPYKCTFCDVQEKEYHYRSTKKIVDEFEYIRSLGIKEIHIFDDTFNLNRRRVIDMCNEILRRGLKIQWTARVRAHPLDREMLALMKKSGCIRLHAGIESLDPLALANMKKQITLEHIKTFFSLCKEFGIQSLTYMILGFPEETEEYRKNFFKALTSVKPTYVFINILYPLAGTRYYNDLLESGFYKMDHWAEFFKSPTPNYTLPACRPLELQNELVKLMDSTHKRYYLSPKLIISELSRITSFKLFLRKIKSAVRLIFANTAKETAKYYYPSNTKSENT